MGALGGFIGPSLIGWLADDSDDDDYDAAMMAIGIFLMCAAVLMLGGHPLPVIDVCKLLSVPICIYAYHQYTLIEGTR